MTAQRRYDLLIAKSEAAVFDYCELRVSELAKFSLLLLIARLIFGL